MKVRTATIEEAPLIASLGANVQRSRHEIRPDWFKPAEEASTVDWYREMLMNPTAAIYLAEDANDAIGFVVAVVHLRPDSPFGRAQTVLEVDQIGVAPSETRRTQNPTGVLGDGIVQSRKRYAAKLPVMSTVQR